MYCNIFKFHMDTQYIINNEYLVKIYKKKSIGNALGFDHGYHFVGQTTLEVIKIN